MSRAVGWALVPLLSLVGLVCLTSASLSSAGAPQGIAPDTATPSSAVSVPQISSCPKTLGGKFQKQTSPTFSFGLHAEERAELWVPALGLEP